MNILALIPARGGSKRLPGKNIRPLGGKPMIAWTIKCAQESGVCDDIVVSTDDQQIAEVAKKYGALVPWIRPIELATDTASSLDVAIHALNAWESSVGQVDALLLLQPTSPFRNPETIRKAVEIFRRRGGAPVVSVSSVVNHPAWCFRIINDTLEPFIKGQLASRSQDLEPAWALNGVIYIITPDQLRAEKTFFPNNVIPLIINDDKESMDVDSLHDFSLCELMLKECGEC